jgi:ATP-binding cassette subfamily C (CFTR/MRP) protein 4
MNRVTKDLSSIDVQLPEVNYDTITIFLQMIGIVTVVVWSNYYVMAPTAFVLAAFYVARTYYVNSARDIKRIDALCKEIPKL